MGGQVTAAHRLAADETFPRCRDGDSAHRQIAETEAAV